MARKSLPLQLTILMLVLLGTRALFAGDQPIPRAPKLPKARSFAVGDLPALDVRLPERPLDTANFRRKGRRGWISRMPHPRKPNSNTDESRLHTVPSPAVLDGLVYAGVGFDGWALHAFDVKTGRHRWTSKFKDNGPTTPTIAPRQKKLVCNTESCTTYVITPRTGKINWSRWVGPSVMGAAAVKDSVVYAGHRTKSNEYVLKAMRLRDGVVLWERALTQDVYGKPIIAGGRIYAGCRDGVVACFELDGRPVWFSRPGAVCAPWVTPHGVYVTEGSSYRKGPPAVRCLDPRTGKTLWRTDTESRPGKTDVARERTATRVVKLMSRYASDGPRPVVIGNQCILAGGRNLIGMDARTGEVRWMRTLPEKRRFHAPPAVLGGSLIYVTLRGLLVEVSARTGEMKQGLDLRMFVSSQPVVAEGRVHVVAGEFLYGIPWGSPAGPSWPQWGGLRGDPMTAPVTGTR